MKVSTNPQFLINQPREKATSVATGLLSGSMQKATLVHEWHDMDMTVLTLTEVHRVADVSAVRDFCDQVSKLGRGIEAVMVEELDSGVQHVTTFLSERAPELEAEIYKVEAGILQKFPEAILDFHVRAVPKDEVGNPELPNGSYYLLTWLAA